LNKRETVIREILARIQNDQLLEGNKLPSERDLAESLGVSRVLLREAIVSLETLGILEVKKRFGIFVRKPDFSGVTENLKMMSFWSENFIPQLMEMRLIIDVHASEFAALRRTEEELAKLEECFANLEKMPPSSPRGVRLHAHYEFLFHSLIVEAAHNAVLARVYEGLMSLMEKNNEVLHMNLAQDMDWVFQVISHHEKTLQAIREKDSLSAAQSMRLHLLESVRRYQGMQNNGLFSLSIETDDPGKDA